MGNSDRFVLPQQADYTLKVCQRFGSKKIAWLGVPHSYLPVDFVQTRLPMIEQHCYDFTAFESDRTHVWDMNSPGWGKSLSSLGFDLLTLFRVSVHANDSDHVVNELHDFMTASPDGTIIFEEIAGREKYNNTSTAYRRSDGKLFAANDCFDRYLEKLDKYFQMSDRKCITYADKDVTGTYVTLRRLT